MAQKCQMALDAYTSKRQWRAADLVASTHSSQDHQCGQPDLRAQSPEKSNSTCQEVVSSGTRNVKLDMSRGKSGGGEMAVYTTTRMLNERKSTDEPALGVKNTAVCPQGPGGEPCTRQSSPRPRVPKLDEISSSSRVRTLQSTLHFLGKDSRGFHF